MAQDQRTDVTGIRWQPQTLSRLTNHPRRFYSYAPSAMQHKGKTFFWWCQNEQDGIVRDSIFYAQRERDLLLSVPRSSFVCGRAGTWDSFHVCDPSVVAGDFRWAKARYRYALFFLGNNVDASRDNQIGVALARELGGPWTRLPDPVVLHPSDGTWGVGQPSAVAQGKGRVSLFYTCGDRGGTRVLRQEIDLSGAAEVRVGQPLTLTNAGLTNSMGKPDYLNNADFAFCPQRKRFYAVREQHPYPADVPRFIGDSLQIVSLSERDARGGGGEWTVEGEITPTLTGFARNHNAGLLRTESGTLSDPRHITVLFSSSAANTQGRPEWTYDLWQITGDLAT